MKRQIVCVLMLAALMVSCVHVNLNDKLKPSTDRVEKTYTMKPFTKLDIGIMARVKFVQGQAGDYRVVLSAPENYVALFDFSVDGDELELDFVKDNINIESELVDVVVFAPTLRSLENSGVASVVIDSLNVYNLKIDNSGVGGLKLHGLSVDRVSVECSGVGGIALGGTANWVSLECSGVGGINARELKARRVRGWVSGVGGIDCYASDTLVARVDGVGSLRYDGHPAHKDMRCEGVGKISEL